MITSSALLIRVVAYDPSLTPNRTPNLSLALSMVHHFTISAGSGKRLTAKSRDTTIRPHSPTSRSSNPRRSSAVQRLFTPTLEAFDRAQRQSAARLCARCAPIDFNRIGMARVGTPNRAVDRNHDGGGQRRTGRPGKIRRAALLRAIELVEGIRQEIKTIMRELTIDAIEAGVSSDQRRTRILQSPVFSFKNALRLAMQEGERIERSRPV